MSKRTDFLSDLVDELNQDKSLAGIPTDKLTHMADAALTAHVETLLEITEAENTLKLLSCLVDMLKVKSLR